ncbi:binding protein [[Candida] boidinii]|nr:binding protein [[Candida] boidinii]
MSSSTRNTNSTDPSPKKKSPGDGSATFNTGNIKVFTRVRPLLARELDANFNSDGINSLISMPPDGQTVILHSGESENSRSLSGRKPSNRIFQFDKCLWSFDKESSNYASQDYTYKIAGEEMLNNTISGYNSCIMAYGQTGSGKTYTMSGSKEEPGLIPLVVDNLFDKLNFISKENELIKFTIKVSFFEIYQESSYDLLSNSASSMSDKKLRIRENSDRIPFVENLKEFEVSSFEEMMGLINKGNKNRTTAATNLNLNSSRSHSILTIKLIQERFIDESLTSCEKIESHLRLVDLAGSEKSIATQSIPLNGNTSNGNNDKLRQKEGNKINNSLTVLGRVLTILSENSNKTVKSTPSVVPYRDSSLTYILKESIGGNSKTSMIACISPIDYDETLNTLRYATITSKIRNKAKLNSTGEASKININEIISNYEKEKNDLLSYIELLKSESENDNDSNIKNSKKLENYIKWQDDYINLNNLRNSINFKKLNNKLNNLNIENEELLKNLIYLNKMKNENTKKLAANNNLINDKINNALNHNDENDMGLDLLNKMNGVINDKESLVSKYLISI